MRSVINIPLEEPGFAHEFLAILVYCEMNSPKRTPSNLILDYVLIDTMLGLAIFLVVYIFGSRIQRLFNFPVLRGLSTVVSERALVGRGRAATLVRSVLLSAEVYTWTQNAQVLNERRSAFGTWDIQRNSCNKVVIMGARRQYGDSGSNCQITM